MAIRFKHGGKQWEVDTPAEAIALRKRLEVRDEQALEYGEAPDWVSESVWTPDKINDLAEELGTQQNKFLAVLWDHGTITSPEIMELIGLGSETALAGVVSGLSKQLVRLGLKPMDLYTVEVRWTGKEKTRTFRLSGDFRSVAELDMGWPDGMPYHMKRAVKALKATQKLIGAK